MITWLSNYYIRSINFKSIGGEIRQSEQNVPLVSVLNPELHTIDTDFKNVLEPQMCSMKNQVTISWYDVEFLRNIYIFRAYAISMTKSGKENKDIHICLSFELTVREKMITFFMIFNISRVTSKQYISV